MFSNPYKREGGREGWKEGGREDAVGVTLWRCVVCASICVSSRPCKIPGRKHLVLAEGKASRFDYSDFPLNVNCSGRQGREVAFHPEF